MDRFSQRFQHHVFYVLTAKIVHQLADIIISLIIAIDVDDVTAILKRPIQFFDDPVDMVAGQAMLPDIVFGNKDDVAFRQFFIVATLSQAVEIEQAAVETGTLRPRAFIGTLHFDIVFRSGRIGGMHIHPYPMAGKIGNRILNLHRFYL